MLLTCSWFFGTGHKIGRYQTPLEITEKSASWKWHLLARGCCTVGILRCIQCLHKLGLGIA